MNDRRKPLRCGFRSIVRDDRQPFLGRRIQVRDIAHPRQGHIQGTPIGAVRKREMGDVRTHRSACAKGAGVATMSMTQNISSPSLDGSSARFTLGGTSPYSHALFYKRLSNNSTATHFIYDVYFSLDKPGNSSAMEYSVSQRVGSCHCSLPCVH